MSTLGTNSIIFKLKNQWFDLEKDVKAMMHNESDIYKKYEKALVVTQQKKKDKLQQWRKKEIEAIHQEYDGEIYAADCDAEKSRKENFEKNSDMIYYKADMIVRQFPEAAKYFADNGYEFPFEKLRQQLTDSNLPKVVTFETNAPLIDRNLIKEDLYEFTDNEIEIPDAMQKSGSMSLAIGNLPVFSGKLSEIQETEANFTVGGEIAQLHINTVRFGDVKCEKV